MSCTDLSKNPFPITECKKPGYPEGYKVQRNDACPCGSRKKYKHCCIGKRKTK